MKRKIRICVPNKGRLKEPTFKLLQKIGIEVFEDKRNYVCPTSDERFEVVLARAFDVPIYVQYGVIDLGITGKDILFERNADVHQLLNLGFGKCKLVVAVPNSSSIKSIEDIENYTRITTEFPNISNRFFKSNGKSVEILEVRGATELAPKLGLGDIIVDITSTGTTLRKNNLRIIDTILSSECTLVCNRVSFRFFESEIMSIVQKLKNLEAQN
jgi:ATP phosphoribosyltransferase